MYFCVVEIMCSVYSDWTKLINKNSNCLVLIWQVMNEDGHTSSIRDKILTINVKPGWRSGTKITFPKEGDQGPNNIPGTCKVNLFLR